MNKIKKDNIIEWSRLGPRAMFGEFMMDIAKKNENLIVLSADLGRSSGLDRFKAKYPSKYISVGICEQNLIGVASGLAKEGHKVFVTSFAPFLSMRASEQIRMNLGYMKIGVNVVALGSGLAMGYLGNSHFGLEDVAVMRTVPGLNIVSPSDTLELKKILNDFSSNNRGPSYIRLTGVPGSKIVYENDFNYKYGEPKILFKGEKLLVLSSGAVTGEVKIAVRKLNDKGKSVCLVNINQLKPFNKKIFTLMKKFEKIITIEEHSIIGGLNSIISEELSKNKKKTKLDSISLPDSFGPTGDYKFLMNFHSLNSEKIYNKILNFISR